MPRTVPAGLATHLQGEVLTIALCVKLTRRDGTVMGFTSLDLPLTVNSVLYEPESAVNPTALRTSEGSAVDNLDVVGMLKSGRITAADIRAGRYDHAQIEMFLVNYKDLPAGQLTLFRGRVGHVTYQQGRFTFELRSQAARLQQHIVDLTSPVCRIRALFDAKCYVGGVNFDNTNTPATFRDTLTVASVTSALVLTFTDPNDRATDYYSEGRVRFNTGANANLEREVKLHTLVSGDARIELHEPFPFAVAVGDQALVEAGCDRRFTTCVTKFANGGNFRGEPDIPGIDQVTRRGRR